MFENELKIAKKYCLCLASFDAIGGATLKKILPGGA